MQIQPKSGELRLGRVQRARQAVHTSDDTFKGGDAAPPPRLGLKRPWMKGMSRLWGDRRPPAESE